MSSWTSPFQSTYTFKLSLLSQLTCPRSNSHTPALISTFPLQFAQLLKVAHPLKFAHQFQFALPLYLRAITVPTQIITSVLISTFIVAISKLLSVCQPPYVLQLYIQQVPVQSPHSFSNIDTSGPVNTHTLKSEHPALFIKCNLIYQGNIRG